MSGLKNTVQVLSTGYIFVYFSEHLFWARVRADDSLSGWFGAWVAYSLMAFVFLVLISHFRVKSIWALFLTGAAFGWIGEGVVVQTTYEMLPLSISFTALAWHALITVWIGWYALRNSLRAPDPWSTLKLSAGIGFFYGLWAINWWVEPPPDGGISSLGGFATFSFVTTGLVILAYALADWSSSEGFVPNRWVVIAISAIIVLYFSLVTLPAAPQAVIVLPILLGLVYWGLQINRRVESEGSLLNSLGGRAPWWKYISLSALPVVAVVVYMLSMLLNLKWATNWVLYLITTPLGFLLFGSSLYFLWRKKPISL
jgi:hypothetical protein